MKKRLIFLLLLVALLAGCIGGLKKPGQEKQLPRGVGVTFIEGFPPAKILEGKPFNVRLDLVNYGSRDASVDISLSDGIGDSFGGVPGYEMQSIRLEGNEGQSSVVYDEETVTFGGPYEYTNVKEGMAATFVATASFDYKYDSTAILCVNGAATGSKNTVCKNEEIITGLALGKDATRSPVAVVQIKKNSFTTEEGDATVSLEITIKDVGNGYVENGKIINFRVDSQDFDFECDRREILFRYSKGEASTERIATCNADGKVASEFLKSPVTLSYDYVYKVSNYYGPVEIVKFERD